MTAESLIARIFGPGGLGVVFQPIVDTANAKWRLVAVEGLIRGPRDAGLEEADLLFEYVRRHRDASVIERACVSTVLKAASRLRGGLDIAVNVNALPLARDRAFPSFVVAAAHEAGVDTAHVVVEVHDCLPYHGDSQFLLALEFLRLQGIRVSIDDLGIESANADLLRDCAPEYFKIDRHLVRGCHKDPFRQASIEAGATLARESGALIIAEGVETEDELVYVEALGISLMQGHFLAPGLPLAELEAHPLYRDHLASWALRKSA
jgi:EAL domain-containing protein (putative c-di-GMP-specific phosphodiesterase class I)